MYHRYTKTGRIFQSMGQLRSFLTYAMGHNVDINDWEIVELEMVVKDVKNAHEVIDPKKLIQLLSS